MGINVPAPSTITATALLEPIYKDTHATEVTMMYMDKSITWDVQFYVCTGSINPNFLAIPV